MHWTVQVTVALLNVVWIVFFWTLDPFQVPVQRRSAEEKEEVTAEFCIQLPQLNISFIETDSSAETRTYNPTSSVPGNEQIRMDGDETASPPPSLDLTSTEATSAESSKSVPLRVADESTEEVDSPPLHPLDLWSPPYFSTPEVPPDCCLKVTHQVPPQFFQQDLPYQRQSPPECPIEAVLITTSSGERYCLHPDVTRRRHDGKATQRHHDGTKYNPF
ncbi:uncharacterized protein LOC117807597 [Notolabrus celidotus]|uniref:uncharacterized protein LOC117807597 n=1 Tax=Notolabrus celidotus TaxID=1203425 RepID=UPI00148FA59B|nr:uncharacterized protein LOC117807597 [Notolabrus celidotus]